MFFVKRAERRILATLEIAPEASGIQLWRATGCNFGSLYTALELLKREGKITSRRGIATSVRYTLNRQTFADKGAKP